MDRCSKGNFYSLYISTKPDVQVFCIGFFFWGRVLEFTMVKGRAAFWSGLEWGGVRCGVNKRIVYLGFFLTYLHTNSLLFEVEAGHKCV